MFQWWFQSKQHVHTGKKSLMIWLKVEQWYTGSCTNRITLCYIDVPIIMGNHTHRYDQYIWDDYVRSFLFNIPLPLHVSLTINYMQSYFVTHITKGQKCKLYRQMPVDGGQFPTECLYMSSRWNGIPRQVSLIISGLISNKNCWGWKPVYWNFQFLLVMAVSVYLKWLWNFGGCGRHC